MILPRPPNERPGLSLEPGRSTVAECLVTVST